MSRTLWRIIRSRFALSAFDGKAASRAGGRWNSPGVPMIYTAQTQALAALEMLVHLEPDDLLDAYVVFPVVADGALIEAVLLSTLPNNWRSDRVPEELQAIGDRWIESRKSAVLQVPSVLIPSECNYLVNPAHPDFRRLRVGAAHPFQFDPRLKQ